jgi:hypothetical protein
MRHHRSPASAPIAAIAAITVCAISLPAHAQVRDTPVAPRVVGTAVVAGRVLAADESATPIRRALVTLSGSGLAHSRTAITGDDGTFEITQVPAGRFALTASKPAYLSVSFGADRPGRQGTSLLIADGQRVDATLRMARGAVIAGLVRDAEGRPIAGAEVHALDATDPRSPFRPGSVGIATNDRGEYRVFGLVPGEYLVLVVPRMGRRVGGLTVQSEESVDAAFARLRERQAVGGRGEGPRPMSSPPPASRPADQPVDFPPLYFPGTAVFSQAERLRVAAGQTRFGVDFSVAPVRMAAIEGTIVGAADASSNIQLAIEPEGPRLSGFQGPRLQLAEPPGPDGRFRYANVAPGRYRLVARATPGSAASASPGARGGGGAATSLMIPGRGAAPAGTRYAAEFVDVAGQDVSGVTLTLQPGATLSGRVVFDAHTTAAPGDLGRIRVGLSAPGGTGYSSSGGTVIGNPFSSVSPVTLDADGRFTMEGIAPGTYLLRASMPADISAGWWFESAVLDGRDLLDELLEVRAGDRLPDAALRFSDRRSELAGTLQTAAGVPAPDYFIVVFPAEPSERIAGSRRIRTTRPGTDGAFSILDLPAGDYLIGALTDVEPRDLADRAFLESVATAAIRVVIRAGERTEQAIRIGG